MIARFLFIPLLVESLLGCASGRPQASTEDLVVAAVLRDVIAEETRWGTPVICAPGRTDPSGTLLGLVRSGATFEVSVCPDLTGDPTDSFRAVTRSTGARAYIVFWNEVAQRESQKYEVQAGFNCGPTCGKLYQYRVGKSEGVWRVLGKVLLSVS